MIVKKRLISQISSFVSTIVFAGSFALISTPASTALTPVGISNTNATVSAGVPTTLNVALLQSASAIAVSSNAATAVGRSVGLVAKDITTGTAQTATVRTAGTLSLYWLSGTSTAISADGGTWSNSVAPNATITNSDGSTAVAFAHTAASGVAHTQATLWTAPSTSGTYTIKAYRATHPGISSDGLPNSTNPLLGTLFGQITVTVSSGTHPSVGGTNSPDTTGGLNSSLFVAVASNTTANAEAHSTVASGRGEDSALSKGLLSKDTSFGTAQTATVLTGGKLSLYGNVSTAAAFSASGGTFSSAISQNGSASVAYGADLKSTIITGPTDAEVAAAIWTAPSTAGTYTVNLLTGFVLTSSGTYVAPSYSTGLPPTLSGRITVTVVASSAGGSYSAAYSACNTNTLTLAASTGTYPSGVDSTSGVADGGDWYIDYDLNDAYNANLASGNMVVTATNGALVNIGTTAGSTPVAGTSSTDVEYTDGVSETIRISQPTSGAPLTTTVTITYNGTTVCTKTVTIAGKVSKLAIANVGTQGLSTSTGSSQWMYQEIGLYSAGLFTILATDSAGNIVATPTTLGTFSADSATLTTIVQGITFPTVSSSTSSSSTARFTLGSWTCGAIAGSANVKVKLTLTATGDIISSDAFNARCANIPYSYTVSMDKATYTQGELAKVTVAFKDSKGNAANSVTAVGANTWSLPQMTGVSFTISSGASATAVTKADGTVTYTFTVGTTSGVTAGTYTGIVDYSVPAGGTSATPTYSVKTGGDTTTNADVLKSIVALIASINKQIQALQKLILKR